MDALVERSTTEVEPRHRLDYWVGAVSESLFAVSSSTPETPEFCVSLAAAPLGPLRLVQTRGTARSARSASGAADHAFHLMVDFGSPTEIECRGTRFKLAPGDVYFGDTRHTQSGRHLTNAMFVRMSPEWAETWMNRPDRFAGSRIDGTSSWGKALSNYLSQLSPQAVAASPLPDRAVCDGLGSLLALTESELMGKPFAGNAPERALSERVRDTVRHRAMECGLTAVDVASSVGISERTLHRCLAGRAETFSRLLLRARVECAKRMLESKNLSGLTTAEIGRRAGFADASYFVRVTTRQLGMTPRRYRIAHLA